MHRKVLFFYLKAMFDFSIQITPEDKVSLYQLKETTSIVFALESTSGRENCIYLSKEQFLMMYRLVKFAKLQIEKEKKHD